MAATAMNPFSIHQDVQSYDESEREEAERPQMSALRSEYPLTEEETDFSDASAESLPDVAVAEDIEKFLNVFQGMSERFRLINRIGEGTFSTVYKAEDLLYDSYHNDWDVESRDSPKWSSPPLKKRRTASKTSSAVARRRPQYVAIKKIYVTSSPNRIQNELELLHDLRGCDAVCPLITAFRHQDQVVAVLPYFRHADFREYFRDFRVSDMRIYFRSLFTALAAVHDHHILHRDIKPTNFLYDIARQRGVLVDFGLAEREGTDCTPCMCGAPSLARRAKMESHGSHAQPAATGYPKHDPRPSRRANRAGTRGFRAPEVLLKCTNQTSKIDIWSTGIILLTILSRRFPFFNSADDIEALIEIATIFGSRRMKHCAALHNTVFDTNIPTIGEKGFSLGKIVLWSTGRTDKQQQQQHQKRDEEDTGDGLSEEESAAVSFLERLLELDPRRRISAEDALKHEFLAEPAPADTTKDSATECKESGDDDEVEML